MITRETIDKIFQTANIEEVIADFVPLKKFGANYKALSPFTEEKTPSFVVSPAKQIFKDFSSGKGGNVVSFLMEHEHFSYPEALKFLANKYSIEVKEERTQDPEEYNKRERLFVINQVVTDLFIENLFSDLGSKWMKYLLERGIKHQTIEEFQLGCATSGFSDYSYHLKKLDYTAAEITGSGLSIDKGGRFLDRFRDRLMFPIQNLTGRVIGFGGRIAPGAANNQAKYINSPETDLYDKSHALYGFYQAKKHIGRTQKCFLVEGYMDVLGLYQSGIENVVACSGTALSRAHARQIRRFCNHIILSYDSDAAGIKATFNAINLLLEENFQVSVLMFPENQDPHDFVTHHARDEVEAYIDQETLDFLPFKVKYYSQKFQGNPHLFSESIGDIIESIAHISDPVRQEIYLKSCAQQLDLSEDLIHQSLAERKHRITQENEKQGLRFSKRKEVVSKIDPIEKPLQDIASQHRFEDRKSKERELLRLLISYGNIEISLPVVFRQSLPEGERYITTVAEEMIAHFQQDQLSFLDPLFQRVFKEVLSLVEQDRLPADSYFLLHHKLEISKLSNELVTEKYSIEDWGKKGIEIPAPDIARNLEDALLRWKAILITQKLIDYEKELQGAREEEKESIYKKIEEKLMIRRDIYQKIHYSSL